uniref:LISCH7 domain-containing protein n=1 Tax=Knipowitschia caucasica TaxID=637954 RepID=A0AAV2M9F3_KNICA
MDSKTWGTLLLAALMTSDFCASITVECPRKRIVAILFQPVTVDCKYQSSSQRPVVLWKYKSYCRDPVQAALNPNSAENILAQNNPNYDPNIECADSQRTVRNVASKDGSTVTLGPEYQGRKISILNVYETWGRRPDLLSLCCVSVHADLNLGQTAVCVCRESPPHREPSPRCVRAESPSPRCVRAESPSPRCVRAESPSPRCVCAESPPPGVCVQRAPPPGVCVQRAPPPGVCVQRAPPPGVCVQRAPPPGVCVQRALPQVCACREPLPQCGVCAESPPPGVCVQRAPPPGVCVQRAPLPQVCVCREPPCPRCVCRHRGVCAESPPPFKRKSNTTDLLPEVDLLVMEDWLLVVLVVLGFLLLLLLIGICWCQCCPHTCCCYVSCPCCPERCCCPRALYEAGKAVKKGMAGQYAATMYAPSVYGQPAYSGMGQPAYSGMGQPAMPMLPLPNGTGAAPPNHGYGRDHDGASSVGQGSQVPLLRDQDGGDHKGLWTPLPEDQRDCGPPSLRIRGTVGPPSLRIRGTVDPLPEDQRDCGPPSLRIRGTVDSPSLWTVDPPPMRIRGTVDTPP